MFFKKARTKRKIIILASEILVDYFPELADLEHPDEYNSYVEKFIYTCILGNQYISEQYDLIYHAQEYSKTPDRKRAVLMMSFLIEQLTVGPDTPHKDLMVYNAMAEHTAEIREAMARL